MTRRSADLPQVPDDDRSRFMQQMLLKPHMLAQPDPATIRKRTTFNPSSRDTVHIAAMLTESYDFEAAELTAMLYTLVEMTTQGDDSLTPTPHLESLVLEEYPNDENLQ